MNQKVLDVFNSFKVESKALPILKNIYVDDKCARKTDLDRQLVYYGKPFPESSEGVLEAKKTVLVDTTFKPEEFPSAVRPGKELLMSKVMHKKVLSDMLHRAVMFTFRGTDRYTLRGMLWSWNKNGIVVISTDGKRLYRESIELIAEVEKTGKAIVVVTPASVAVIDSMMRAEENAMMAQISVYKTTAFIRVGNFELSVKCEEASLYPNTDKFLVEQQTGAKYEIFGLTDAVKYLKQFENKSKYEPETVAVEIYPDKMVLGKGVYSSVSVKKTFKEDIQFKGTILHPCLITMCMNRDEGKEYIAQYHIDYLSDVAKLFGNNVVMFLYRDATTERGYFTTRSQAW